MRRLDRADRRALQRVLRSVAPWLLDPVAGPTVVDAGDCARCGTRPGVVPTCGPQAPGALCADCALDAESDGDWCTGHVAERTHARAWARRLPDRWGDLVVLWWIATGEVRHTDRAGTVEPDGLPAPVRAVLDARATDAG